MTTPSRGINKSGHSRYKEVILNLNPKQELAITTPTRRLLLSGGIRAGKCFERNTPILMYNGSIKFVQDIRIGDVVMGDDSKPRNVVSLHSGLDEMYEIKPNKFESYTVNSQHILCLKSSYRLTHGGKLIKEINYNNISVSDYLKTSNKFKSRNKVYKTGVDFNPRPTKIDPYFLGLWLGDGNSANIGITNTDPELISYIYDVADKHNLKVRISCGITYFLAGKSYHSNTLLKTFQEEGLINNKHIPHNYLINSRSNRLNLLAGLIDSDGYVDPTGKCIEISQKNKELAYQIVFLAQSLGFHSSIREEYKTCQTGKGGFYQRVYIGGDFSCIPAKVSRKKSIFKPTHKTNGHRMDDVLMSGFEVVPKGKDIYYGFEIDGNNKFLLGSFHVVHNTTCGLMKIKEIATRMPGSQILVVRKTLKEIRDDVWKILYNPTDGILANTRMYGQLNKSNYEHQLPNGSKILYRQADDPKKLLGLDLSCIYFEQGENISKDYFEHALGRLTHWGDIKNPDSRGARYIQKYGDGAYASTIAKKPSHFFIMSVNPDTGSWIYDDIIRTCDNYSAATPHVKHQTLGWDIINFQTYDNIQLPNVASFIEEQKANTSDSYFRRMILGEWIGAEGQIFSHFDVRKHISTDWEYDTHVPEMTLDGSRQKVDGLGQPSYKIVKGSDRWEVICAIDPGSAWYTGIVFGAYDKKYQQYVIFDELKTRDMLIPEVCEEIKKILDLYKIPMDKVQFLIDAAANAKESNGVSKADQYRKCKIYPTNANKTLDGALERINGLFKTNNISITGNCTYLLNDIKSYKYGKDGKPDKGTGSKAFDMADAFRYICNQYAFGLEVEKKSVAQIIKESDLTPYQKYLNTQIWLKNTPDDPDVKAQRGYGW